MTDEMRIMLWVLAGLMTIFPFVIGLYLESMYNDVGYTSCEHPKDAVLIDTKKNNNIYITEVDVVTKCPLCLDSIEIQDAITTCHKCRSKHHRDCLKEFATCGICK